MITTANSGRYTNTMTTNTGINKHIQKILKNEKQHKAYFKNHPNDNPYKICANCNRLYSEHSDFSSYCPKYISHKREVYVFNFNSKFKKDRKKTDQLRLMLRVLL